MDPKAARVKYKTLAKRKWKEDKESKREIERKGSKVVAEEGGGKVRKAGSDDDSVLSDVGMDPVEYESEGAVMLQPRAS